MNKLLLLLLPFIIQSCSSEEKLPTRPYRAQVVMLDTSIPTVGAPAKFVLKTVEYKYLEDLNSLNSQFLKILRGGILDVMKFSGAQINEARFSDGQSPGLRYSVKNGVVVPKDYTTLAMLSAFYQYEQVFSEVENLTGYDLATLTKNAQGKKFQVMFEPRIILDLGAIQFSATDKLNAAYLSGKKQFALMQRSGQEKIPLAANLQVIGHEFGHALFEHSFYQDEFKNIDNRWQRECAMRGINEGFSDFFSYLITGSTNILHGSLDVDALVKQRNFSTIDFSYEDWLNRSDKCTGSFYCVGSVFAGSLYDSEIALKLESTTYNKADFSKSIVASLAKSKTDLESAEFADFIPTALAKDVDDCSPLKTQAEDHLRLKRMNKTLSAFLAAFVKNLDADYKESVCTSFSHENRFGNYGFDLSVRPLAGCP